MSVDLLAIALLATSFGMTPNSEDEVMLWRYAGTVKIHDAERQVSLAVLDGLSPAQDFELKTGYRVESNGGFEVSIGQRATIDVRGADTLSLTAIDAGSASFRFGSGRNVIFKLNGLILTAEFPGELILATESQGESLIQVATIGENLLIKNIQGADVLIYRGNDPLHRIEAGNRLEVPIVAAASPRVPNPGFSGLPPDQRETSVPPVDSSAGADPEIAPTAARDGETFEGPRLLVWAQQVVRLPLGVRASVEVADGHSRLELERDPGASGIAVVKLGAARLLMGPGARLVINEAGRVVAVQGQVIGGPGFVGLGAGSSSGGGFGGASFVAPNPYEQSNQFSPGHDG